MRRTPLLVALMLTVVGFAWTPTARAQQPVPGIPFITNVVVEQLPNREVSLYVDGYFPDSTCWVIQGPDVKSPFTLGMVHLLPPNCPDSLQSGNGHWNWRFSLGQLANGTHAILLGVNVVEGPNSTLYQGSYTFQIPPPSSALPYVQEIRFDPLYRPGQPITPNDSILVTIRGEFPTPCFEITELRLGLERRFVPPPIYMTVDRHSCVGCATVMTPFEAHIVQGPLSAGTHVQSFLLFEKDCGDSIVASHSVQIPLEIAGGGDSIRYLSRIIVSAAGRPPGSPICVNDSVRVRFEGEFPTACGVVENYPGLFTVVLDRSNCAEACAQVPTPWSHEIVLPPPFAAGTHNIHGEVVVTDCTPSNVIQVEPMDVTFNVVPDCPPPSMGCILPGFVGDQVSKSCDASFGPDGRATLYFELRTNIPLAGVEAAFVLDPAGLIIENLEAVGPVQGWQLTWRRTANGARFNIFSDDDSTYGPCPPAPPDYYLCDARILRITVRKNANTVAPVTNLRAIDLLASDAYGQGVSGCPTARFAEIVAHICNNVACDVNFDGVGDIRDLVLMVRCLNSPHDDRSLPWVCTYDCNGDSLSSLDDVLCCARRILRGPPCHDCPPDTTTVRPGAVQVSLGMPVVSTDRVVVPVRLTGSEYLGGARLELAFPSDRYDVEDLSLAGGRSDWLSLYEVNGNHVVGGMIRLTPVITTEVNQVLELLLTLRLKPGQTPGGEIRSAGGEFSGNDGKLLQVPFAVVQPLGAPARLAMSEPQPNPFRNETAFSITLDEAADVTVGIYDLSGRLVATPQRGRLTAGAHPIVWNGKDASGESLPNGVYFALAVSGEARASRKLVLLKGN